jgi:hypothetical protein
LIFALVLLTGIRGAVGVRSEHGQLFSRLFILGPILVVAFSCVGALIIRRFPRHPVGWILAALGLLCGLSFWATAYTAYDLYGPRPNLLPGARFSHWLESWLWVPTTLLPATHLILLFPDGKPPDARWRPLLWLSTTAMVMLILGIQFMPGQISGSVFEGENPYGLEGLPGPLSVLSQLGAILAAVAIVGAISSIVFRFRKARGEVRQQIKWIAFAVTVSGLLLISASIFSALAVDNLWRVVVAINLIGLATATIPIAIGFAILRYRLYDIEILIRRTLIYGAFTGTLAMVCAAAVIVLQGVFPAQSQLATVLSTLAVAALFSPLRRGIQHLIDQRFYRRSYNAAQALANFGAALRQEVNLEVMSDSILDVVSETMQPEHASLWLVDTDERLPRS